MDVSSPLFSYSSLSSDSEIYNVSSPESLTEGRPKSRRTRCKNPSKQRRNASEKEKLRMRDLTKALHYLRTFLPPFVAPAGQTLTKIETLRLAIRYISYLSSQLDLQVSYYHNEELRSHPASTSHSGEGVNLGNDMETFHFQNDKPSHCDFYQSWTRHPGRTHTDEEDNIIAPPPLPPPPPHSDIISDFRLYEGHITLQSGSRFIQVDTEQRAGIPVEIPRCEVFSSDFHSVMNQQTSQSHQDYSKSVVWESSGPDV